MILTNDTKKSSSFKSRIHVCLQATNYHTYLITPNVPRPSLLVKSRRVLFQISMSNTYHGHEHAHIPYVYIHLWRRHENMSSCTGGRVNANYKRTALCHGAWFRDTFRHYIYHYIYIYIYLCNMYPLYSAALKLRLKTFPRGLKHICCVPTPTAATRPTEAPDDLSKARDLRTVCVCHAPSEGS